MNDKEQMTKAIKNISEEDILNMQLDQIDNQAVNLINAINGLKKVINSKYLDDDNRKALIDSVESLAREHSNSVYETSQNVKDFIN